ncbi:hypothetical protein ACI79D_09860 [Geodermatophilus sp. SYSU D00708]
MLWLAVASCVLVALTVSLFALRRREAAFGVPTFRVVRGRFSEMARERLVRELAPMELSFADGHVLNPVADAEATSARRRRGLFGGRSSRRRRTSTHDAAFAATPEAMALLYGSGETLVDVLRLDDSVLGALRQLSGQQVDGLADFRSLQDARQYQLMSIKLRGTVGEHEVHRHFSEAGYDVTWPSGGKTEFGPSNNPGWDLSVDGHPVNVKVTQDAASAIDQHFAQYPDVPLVLNGDAGNLPADALVFDGSTTFDAAELVGDHVVIVDQSLTLSGIEHAQALAENAADPSWVDATDHVPGLSFLAAAVRSGYKEGALFFGGKTDIQRALKNVALDAAGKGGGGMLGGAAGAKVGAAVDAATLGATMGLGTLIGMAIGALGGAMVGSQITTNVKLQPLRDAQDRLKTALGRLEQAVADERAASADRLHREEQQMSARFQCQRAAARVAYDDLLTRLAAEHRDVTSLNAAELRSILAEAEVAVRRAVEDLTRRLELRGSLERRSSRRRLRASQDAAANWQRQADEAARACLLSEDRTSDFFDVILAAPNGVALAEAHLSTVIAASNRLRVTAVEGNRRMVDAILTARAGTVATLEQARTAELARAHEALAQYKTEVTEAHDRTKDELARAGAAT